jgi:tetratricopeptide (TPR) repeat protein
VKRVLLIGWDAADWKVARPLIEGGFMPSLGGLVAGGVSGNLTTLQPPLSPLVWTSVATGVRPDRHGILGFVEPDPRTGATRPVTSTSRRVKALWNMLSQEGLRSHVVSWYASHPAEPIRGTMVSNLFGLPSGAGVDTWPLIPGSVHPKHLTQVLAAARVHPAELGAGHLLPFVPEAARIDQDNDRRLEKVAFALAACSTVHAAATHLIEHEPWDFCAVFYDAIDRFCHDFMAYHPPRMDTVSEADFELYQHVIRGAYRFHDMMLGRLLELAGPETTVILVSDHGFHSDHLRPRSASSGDDHDPASWHRLHGMFCMHGPGVRRGEPVAGASVLDVAPTVLTLFGLPVGDDMVGRTLSEAFVAPPAVATIASWETREGASGQHDPALVEDAYDAHEALRHLIELGYVADPGDDAARAVELADRARRFNLATVQLSAGDVEAAIAGAEALHRDHADDFGYGCFLAHCYLAGRRTDEAGPLLDQLAGQRGGSRAALEPLRARHAEATGNADRAIEHLRASSDPASPSPWLECELGRLHLTMRRIDAAEAHLQRALELDPEHAAAHEQLAKLRLEQGRNLDAAEAALEAVTLVYGLPQAHFYLGVALARVGDFARSRLALETCLKLRPKHQGATRTLAELEERTRQAR